MEYTILSNYSEIDKNSWSNFVYKHPNGNIFQTPEMFDLYQITPNSEPFIFVALNNTEIVGVLLAVVYKEFGWVLGTLTSRSIIIGGPLVADDNSEVALALMTTYNRRIKSKAIYSQIRNIFDVSHLKNVFQKLNYIYEEHLDILIDLKKSEEELWKEVQKKRRQEIRKAEKENLLVKEINSVQERNTIYLILKEVYSRAKLPLASKTFFDNAYAVFFEEGLIKFYAVFDNDNLIGGRIVLCYKNEIYDWYAGSFMLYEKKGPNNILPWKIFMDAKSRGFERFNFGGAGKPNKPYGVRDYKKKFGGEFVNFGRYELIHKPFIYGIVSRLFILSQKLRKLV